MATESTDRTNEFLLWKIKKINEGNNGIIMELDLRNDDLEVRNFFLSTGKTPKEDIYAIKLIKVYSPGKAESEFSLQKLVYEALQEMEEVAKIPSPYFFTEIGIKSFSTQEILKNIGVTHATDKIELFLMDFVPGKDLARVFYEEVAHRHPTLADIRSQVFSLPFDELRSYVGMALGFSLPGGKHRTESANRFEAEMVMEENAEKLFSFLENELSPQIKETLAQQRKGIYHPFSEQNQFLFDPKIRKIVENTIQALHKKALYHRDLHERNIMITPFGDVFLIDFGTSIQTTDESSTYEDMFGRRYVEDETILEKLKRLETSRHQKVKKVQDIFFAEVDKILNENLKTDSGLPRNMEALFNKIESKKDFGKLSKKQREKFFSDMNDDVARLGTSMNEDINKKIKIGVLLQLGKTESVLKIIIEYIQWALTQGESALDRNSLNYALSRIKRKQD